MKQHLLTALTLFSLNLGLFAQDQTNPTKQGWNTDGVFTILMNQSAFSNWVAGGENNFAANLNLNYNFNFYQGNFAWENKLLGSYGFTKNQQSAYTKKTDDQLNYLSVMSLRGDTGKHFSFMTNFKTQFYKGYTYYTGDDGNEYRDLNTKFFSPAYLMFGPGLLIESVKNLSLNISPANAKFTFVSKDFTSQPGYVDGSYFGVDAFKGSRFELGFNTTATYKVTLMENVTMENLLTLYSNYLEDPQNIDIDYTMNIIMKINKLLSTNFTFQAIYDDNAFEGFQIREVFGLGLNASF
ncbi:MAG: DUF3078 domain-containing protein [Flavobacteriaceae bacterium]